MHVEFVDKQGGPERLVCEAEVVFDAEGPLGGLKLVGFNLWRAVDGGVYVTLPSRAFGAGRERKYFDYVRSCSEDLSEIRRVKDWILSQYQERGAS